MDGSALPNGPARWEVRVIFSDREVTKSLGGRWWWLPKVSMGNTTET